MKFARKIRQHFVSRTHQYIYVNALSLKFHLNNWMREDISFDHVGEFCNVE